MIIFKLKKYYNGTWYILAPKGHTLAGPFHGNKFEAIEWAQAYISSWACSSLEIEE